MSTWSELDDARIARENEKLNMAYAEGRKDEREASCVDELVAALNGLMQVEGRGRIMPIGREWDAARAVLTKLEQS